MKIGKINSNLAGFFSNFRGTLYTLYKCEEMGFIPLIEWKNSLYLDSSIGDNVWDYYFESIKPSNLECDNLNIINLPFDYSWDKKSITRERSNSVIKKYIKLNSELENKINKFWNDNFFETKNVLGVHLRMTDKFNCEKFGEPTTGKPVSIDKYILHCKKYLEIHPEAKIYLATDSLDGISLFKKEFGNKLIFKKEVIRSTGEKSVHHNIKGDNYKKGEDVLVDCILLSKCDFLFKGISNVAVCSLFFNKDLEHFNLNEYYNKDMRESFIKSTNKYI